MMMKIGENIKRLRKENVVSQEVLANHLGVSFQAVSKWETGIAMPDVMLIPAIASFFGVSIDELFDFNVYEIEREVERLRDAAYEHRRVGEFAQAQAILRDGLKRFPGNPLLINNLLYVLDEKTQGEELVMLCKQLINTTHDDCIKYDACRILAEYYKANGEIALVKPILEQIPEIYFSKLQLKALLLEGEEAHCAAQLELGVALERSVEMLSVIADYEKTHKQAEKARATYTRAIKMLEIMQADLNNPVWKSYYERFKTEVDSVFDCKTKPRDSRVVG